MFENFIDKATTKHWLGRTSGALQWTHCDNPYCTMRSVSADANLQPCSDCETISSVRRNVASGLLLELPSSTSTSSSLSYKSKNNTHYSVVSFELQKKRTTHTNLPTAITFRSLFAAVRRKMWSSFGLFRVGLEFLRVKS